MKDDLEKDLNVPSEDGSIMHGINTYKKCPKCGGTNFEVRNYSMMWHDGDVYCVPCNQYVRGYDAG
jgi:uncharacterized Zn finger protein (UPF0148 family)